MLSFYIKRLNFLLIFCLTLLTLIVTTVPKVYAGNGTFKNGEFNFCASVRFNASPAQINQIKTAFQNGSDVLLDATDGQHRFGKVTIVNNSGASQTAEHWINAGGGRAYATYGQYGRRGQHTNLYFESNFQAANGSDGDAYTIAHEHTHHAYGVADEYSGPAGNAEDAPTPDTAILNYSLMDNYFTRGGRAFGGNYTLNEYCVASNHDPDKDTYQESINGKSVWETIASSTRFPATAPATLPVDAPPASQPVTFVNGFGELRSVLLIDRSGSMALDQRLDFAKLGANQFVDLLQDGDGIGVTSFDTSPSVNFPLATVTNAVRTRAKSSIGSLFPGDSTNIGGGLLTALGQFTSQSDRSCNEVIVLLSDGDHNIGTPPSGAIPALKSEGITVLTVGVGSGISTEGEAALQNIASQTGGRFFRVANSADLTNVFLQLSAETSGSGLLANAPESVLSNQVREFNVFVESGASKAVFALTKNLFSDNITLSLRTPSGNTITPANADKFITNPNSMVFEILAPEAGTWKLIVTSGAGVTNGQIDLLAFAHHDGVQLNVSVENELVTFPETVKISATPLFEGAAVVGATVNGIVRRPNGSTVAITLLDNGLGADKFPSDGIYSATFSQYKDDGTYTFDLAAAVNVASTFSGESLFISAGDPSSERVIPNFVRLASATAVVKGVPQSVDVAITKTASPNPVEVDNDLTYTLKVTNNGSTTASGVVVNDNLPTSNISVVSATSTQGSCAVTGSVSCSLGTLPSGASATVSIIVHVNSAGTLTNRASVTANEDDFNTANNSSAVTTSSKFLCFGVEATIVGSLGADSILGTLSNDVIVTRAGNDSVNGLLGDDLICSGDGNDSINAGNGNDKIESGKGIDLINAGSGNDQVFGGDDGDSINGGSGNDTINGGNGIDKVNGSSGIDICLNSEINSNCP